MTPAAATLHDATESVDSPQPIAAPPGRLPMVRLEAELSALRRSWREARPFPHLVIDDFLDPTTLAAAVAEFPAPGSMRWIEYKHLNESTLGKSDRAAFPPLLGALVDELNREDFVAWVSEVTGIPDLRADPSFEGGGLHQTERGGFLNVHADFLRHPRQPTWRRRCNLILYLNPGWRDDWKGALELWEADMSRATVAVAPLANRVVLFATDEDSFHGYPEPIACPPEAPRRSLALYYYTVESAPIRSRSTDYQPRPGDGLGKSLLIRLDALAIAVFSRVKRHLGLSDELVGRWLSRIARLLPRRSHR